MANRVQPRDMEVLSPSSFEKFSHKFGGMYWNKARKKYSFFSLQSIYLINPENMVTSHPKQSNVS